MQQQKIIKFLKENLKVELTHPLKDVGYYSPWYEENKEEVKIVIKLCGETICEATT